MPKTSVNSQDVKDGSLTDADVAAANKDGTGATPSLRTLGAGAAQAAPGNHAHVHSTNTSLAADDHPQYDLLAGRAGGQTLIGGTAASELLRLQSTAHATRGDVEIEDALRFLEQAAAPPQSSAGPQLYSKNKVIWEQIVAGAIPLQFVPGSWVGTMFSTGVPGLLIPNANTSNAAESFLHGSGLLRGITVSGTETVVLDVNGRYAVYTTGSVLNNVAGVETIDLMMRRDQNFISQVKFALAATTSCRVFIGWTDQTLATMLGADQPAGLYFGLQYSTPRGDTVFRHVRQNATPTFTNTSTTIAVDTAFHYIRYIYLGGTPVVQLLDATLANQFAGTISAMPAVTTNMKFVAGIATELVATPRALDIGMATIVQGIPSA